MNVVNRFYKATLHQIPVTRLRLLFARILYTLLHHILRKDNHLIRRKGIYYEIDLSEGIDLSLFLFGNFQNHVTHNKLFSLAEDAVVFDIGANIGSMAFGFAQLTPHGHVFAFEPTNYAFEKLIRNLTLNPELSRRITPVQLFVSDNNSENHQIKAYSSWKVDGSAADRHPLHGGITKPAESIHITTLDHFCLQNDIHKVDLIKIDTDGHEFPVLRGAYKTLEKNHPYLIFEVGLYVLNEQKMAFEQYYDLLSHFGYCLLNCKNYSEITLENFKQQIPARSTIDILAIPHKAGS